MLNSCVPWPAEFARRYIEAGLWEGVTVAEMVERTARRLPQKVALVCGEERDHLSGADSIGQTSRFRGTVRLGLKPQVSRNCQTPAVRSSCRCIWR